MQKEWEETQRIIQGSGTVDYWCERIRALPGYSDGSKFVLSFHFDYQLDQGFTKVKREVCEALNGVKIRNRAWFTSERAFEEVDHIVGEYVIFRDDLLPTYIETHWGNAEEAISFFADQIPMLVENELQSRCFAHTEDTLEIRPKWHVEFMFGTFDFLLNEINQYLKLSNLSARAVGIPRKPIEHTKITVSVTN